MIINREISWLDFNKRVLYEMIDPSVSLPDQMKFSAIFSSNLDEFFMVRASAIKNQILSGYIKKDPSGMTPTEVFTAIEEKVRELTKVQAQFTTERLKQLKEYGFDLARLPELSKEDSDYLAEKFKLEIYSVLTPMAVDFSRPFPLLANKAIYIGAKLSVDDAEKLAFVQVPAVLDRLIHVPSGRYVLLEDVIEKYVGQLFSGHKVLETCQFRVTRNGDIDIIEEEIEDLLMVMEEALKLRKWGATIRLELKDGTDPWLLENLKKSLEIEGEAVFYTSEIIDYTFLFGLPITSYTKELPYKQKKIVQPEKNIFKAMKNGDLFLHHPYESFEPVVNFIKAAAKDENVLAIKQTLYRVSGNSPIVRALSDAAEKGKQVTVLVELRARFDEENNINWAKKLEKKGAHVLYGLYGLKTHSKITLVVKKEKNKIRRYLHLSTGNYNDQTSRIYTDMAYMTSREDFGSDSSIFFNMISGFMSSVKTNNLVVAPYKLRGKFEELIDRETKNAKAGKKARIIAKMNSLVDPDIVLKLYRASNAGVKIDLVVRGICVLVPGIEDISENIRVKSIVGEFLEHSRIFYFENAGKSEIYLSSADWMPRNLNRRIELMFPIVDQTIADRIKATLQLYLKDDKKSWIMDEKAQYHKNGGEISAQEILKSLEYDTHEEFIQALKKRLSKLEKKG